MIAHCGAAVAVPHLSNPSSPAVAPGFLFLETRHGRLVRPLRLRSRGQAALPHCRTRAFTPAGDNTALSTWIFRSVLIRLTLNTTRCWNRCVPPSFQGLSLGGGATFRRITAAATTDTARKKNPSPVKPASESTNPPIDGPANAPT